MSSPTTNIHVSFTGETAEDIMGQIQAMAIRGGASALHLVGTEELLAELRDRLVKPQGRFRWQAGLAGT
jgi:hypothetical protein